jgi:hypothetical protein
MDDVASIRHTSFAKFQRRFDAAVLAYMHSFILFNLISKSLIYEKSFKSMEFQFSVEGIFS